MPSPAHRARRHLASCAFVVALLAVSISPANAQDRYELSPGDDWEKIAEPEPGTREAEIAAMRRALAEGQATRAYNLADKFITQYDHNPLAAWAYLVRADAQVMQRSYYESLYDYEHVIRRYPSADTFGPANEREFEIALLFVNGMNRKWLGMRILSAKDEGEELLIRVQERMQGSELAARAGIELADYYFRERKMGLAAEMYAIFLKNYPRSPDRDKARRRLIYAHLAGFKGPEYDAVGLAEARAELELMQSGHPAEAERLGAQALVTRIDESAALKLLTTAKWYDYVGDPVGAEYTIRHLVSTYPTSAATAEGLEFIAKVLPRLPQSTRDSTIDYALLREAILGVQRPAVDDVEPDAGEPDGEVPDTASPDAGATAS